MVMAFFCGYELPKYITHTNLVLIPKKNIVSRFSDPRPRSLSTFVNKDIFKVIHSRLIKFLPRIISKNQLRFMKGGSICKNMLLAQKINKDINKKNKPHNVVVKLDMAKAYDRIS